MSKRLDELDEVSAKGAEHYEWTLVDAYDDMAAVVRAVGQLNSRYRRDNTDLNTMDELVWVVVEAYRKFEDGE